MPRCSLALLSCSWNHFEKTSFCVHLRCGDMYWSGRTKCWLTRAEQGESRPPRHSQQKRGCSRFLPEEQQFLTDSICAQRKSGHFFQRTPWPAAQGLCDYRGSSSGGCNLSLTQRISTGCGGSSSCWNSVSSVSGPSAAGSCLTSELPCAHP